MKFLILVTLGLLFSLGFCTQYSISGFHGPPFTVKPPAGMYELGGLGLDNLPNGAQLLAYGDFDSNKYTDIVIVDDNLRKLTIMAYSHDSYSFSSLATIELKENIAAVIPGDYNYDGRLDLLVVTETSSSTEPEIGLNYFFQSQADHTFGKSDNEPNLSTRIAGTVQPFVLDIDGDRKLDVLFIEDGARKFHYIDDSQISASKDFSDYVSSDSGCLAYSEVSGNAFASPHSNAFLDFNGDCAADLFITSVDSSNNIVFETWLRKDSKFCLVDVTIISDKISQVSFGDINKDGRFDLIYAVEPADLSLPMTIRVIFNHFAADPSSPCTLINKQMQSPWTKNAFTSTETATGVQILSFSSSLLASMRLYPSNKAHRPSKIRVGDINIDGYTDLLFVAYDAKKENSLYGSIQLAINQGGVLTLNETALSQDDQAYFQIKDDDSLTTSGDTLISTYNAQSASFFDFDELGNLGFWIVVQTPNSPSSSLIGVFNYINSENFILKTLGLNGFHLENSDDITNSLGGIYYGSSVECKVTEIDGSAILLKGNQMPQSAYTPLDLPYIFIGLGRTNNYVENFVMGITASHGSSDFQQQTWTPIIPNSQLIVNTLKDKAWTLDVYVNPTSETIMIVFTTLVILVVLGAFILYLHAKEKEEDLRKRKKIVVM